MGNGNSTTQPFLTTQRLVAAPTKPKEQDEASSLLNIISGEVQSYWEQPYAQPYFDNSTRREITATVGQSALLHCRVRNLGDRAVSWIRKRDLHILTVGILTYTNDQRFQSLHTEGSDEWTLRITSPQPRDSGTYECQVSTEPKISQAFRLSVVGKFRGHRHRVRFIS
nr:uncharacterized protein LOC115261579 [Aedes albopictus]